MVPEEFHCKAHRRVQDHVPADHRSAAMLAVDVPPEEGEDESFGETFIKLRRVQRDPERHIRKLMGGVFRERDRPGKVAFASPAATCREASKAANSVAESDARSKYIRSL